MMNLSIKPSGAPASKAIKERSCYRPSPLLLLPVLLPAILTLASCSYMSQGVFNDEDRGALADSDDAYGDSANQIVYLDQNWDAADSLWFYNTTQGSNLMPYDIFLHLEQAESTSLFRDNDNMRRFRYLAQKPSWDNEDGLPVGWVKDSYQDQDYVGFTCSACHTTQINYQGYGIRVDGAPTLADMESMLISLAQAVSASLAQPEKFNRLAKNVLGENYPAGVGAFRAKLSQVQKDCIEYNTTNAPRHGDEVVHYGYGRLDAFGRIFNRVLTHLAPGEDNANPANAPVSYPFLWDTPQHDFVQWNGIGDNAGEGALGRNTGEVIGVFASFDLDKQNGDIGYRSSANNHNQIRLEGHIKSLWSPLWPNELPAIDQILADKGRDVFVEYRCHQCHESIDRTSTERRVTAQFTSLDLIGTDPFMATNALTDAGKSGYFEGTAISPAELITPKKLRDPNAPKFGETTIVVPALTKATFGVLLEPDHDKSWLRRVSEKAYNLIIAFFDNPIKKTERHVDFEVVDKDDNKFLNAYKGRPLNGIWATAPYLHNGSVPNLYELFLPSCSDAEIESGKTCRANEFTLGAREFDPVKVGFVQRDAAEYPGLFSFDTRLPSNGNQGHEYVVGKTPVLALNADGNPVKGPDGKPVKEWLPVISDAQRLALVEYLKTL